MADSVTNDFQVYASTGSDRREMLAFVPAECKRVLDVGCNVGKFGALLREERGAEVWGIEADPGAASIAAESLDRAISGFFGHNPELDGEKFDCIVFNDVLEHMVDPYSAIEYAKRLLTPNGRVVASIPNVRYFDNVWKLVINGKWEYTDTGILDRTHLRFFTKASILSLFLERGYIVETIQGINAVDWAHPEKRQLFRYLNLILAKRLDDMRWMQYAVVGKLGNT